LIVTKEGAGRVTLPHEDILLRAGDAVLFAPGALQDYSTDEETGHWHLRWVHFQPRFHWRPWLMWPEIAPKVGRLSLGGSTEASVNSALERMLTVSHLGGSHWEDLAMNALEEALVWTFRLIEDERLRGIDPRVQRAAHYLATHPNQPFQLNKLAAHCSLSPSRFSHLFQAELGATPQQFSEKLRLEAARQLLAQTNLTVAEVAAEVGYADPFYFSRRFRRLFDRSPTDERP
jgi:AraC family transcriptional regulator of arabinose operon